MCMDAPSVTPYYLNERNEETTLICSKIVKKYGGVLVLNNVDFSLSKGEIHALVGENGAGKSTLTKIIAGVVPKDCGKMELMGEPYWPINLKDALGLGISIVHQESALNYSLNIGENMFIGGLSHFSNRIGLLDWKIIYKKTMLLLEAVDLKLDPRTLVSSIEPGEKRLVEIARALSFNPKVLILDEVTTVLNFKQTQILYKLMREFSKMGGSIIYISHRLEEIFNICDRVTVLRDGKVVETHQVKNVTENDLTKMMVGRNISFGNDSNCEGRVDEKDLIMTVKNLSVEGCFKDISFDVFRGRCVSFAGLSGCGGDQVLGALFGLYKPDGNITLNGKHYRAKSPQYSVSQGISYIPKDRIRDGLIQHFSIGRNIALPNLDVLSKLLFISRKRERKLAQKYISTFNISKNYEAACAHLSGGNQQKVLLSKWIARQAPVLLLNNPTRGVDVGVKFEIYRLLEELKAKKIAIVLVSEELPEIIRLSDTVITLRNGEMTGIFNKSRKMTEELLVEHIV